MALTCKETNTADTRCDGRRNRYGDDRHNTTIAAITHVLMKYVSK